MTFEIGRRLLGGVWRTGPAEEGGSSGGGLELLGPYRVDFDSPEFYNSTGFVLATLEPGQIALDARAWVRTPWTTSGAAVDFEVDLNDAGGSVHTLFYLSNLAGEPVADFGTADAGGSLTNGALARWAIASVGTGQILAKSSADAPTAGACDVYVLVWTP